MMQSISLIYSSQVPKPTDDWCCYGLCSPHLVHLKFNILVFIIVVAVIVIIIAVARWTKE